MSDNGNGSKGPTWAWIVGALMTVVLFFGAYGWNSLDARITKAEARTAELSYLGATASAEYREIIRRLERIEHAVENMPQIRVGIPRSQEFGR